MNDMISKSRARKARIREKEAGKASRRRPGQASTVIGLCLLVLLWLIVMLVLNLEHAIQRNTDSEYLLGLTGQATLIFATLYAAGLSLRIVRPEFTGRISRILLLGLILLVSLVPAKIVMYFADSFPQLPREAAIFALPLVLAPLLATLLADGVVGFVAGLSLGFIFSVMTGRILSMAVAGMIASVVVAYAAQNVRKRARVIRTGISAALAVTACILAMAAFNWQTITTSLLIRQILAALMSGFASAVLALLILPLFETLFKVTTNITLLELSDLGHPLLQRLAIEAPGTYHHSLVVANLAQAAAEEIGANPLLARICAYFHDIGKLTKPEFFAENISMQRNPHDDLPPSMSTLVIAAHVKEGASLAMLHKLPLPVLDVIREHHGTSLMSYFHHKARNRMELELSSGDQAAGQAPVLDESPFRYPGPKPSTMESAIICLADGIEAASRSMEKTTPGHIESLVNDITSQRFDDHQLDDCDLTLRDLTRVRRSFVFTLTNMLHGRIPYPQDESRDKQQTRPPQGESRETEESDSAPDGTGARGRKA